MHGTSRLRPTACFLQLLPLEGSRSITDQPQGGISFHISARKFERARGLRVGAELHSAEVLAEAQNARRVHTQAGLSYFKLGGSN
ncbi:hypothetical protein SRHO_G00018290 [Serrasalmus rhombeus]